MEELKLNIKEFICQIEIIDKYRIKEEREINQEKRLNRTRFLNDKNRINRRKNILKYEKSEKGKASRRLRQQNRRKSLEGLSNEEVLETREFYKNKPSGYSVDHIIPLCKGGSSHVSNLQYLTRKENSQKRY